MMVVGLTGPSGAGKTFASEIFRQCGFRVINADKVARETVSGEPRVIGELEENFGVDIVKPDGSIDRAKLAQRAFRDKNAVDLLNAITHPAIIKNIKSYIASLREEGEEKVLLDAPTLYESGADALCDCVLAVTADKALCASRIIKRDSLSVSEATKRINAQPGNVYYAQKADYVIFNTGDTEKFSEDIRRFIASL